MSEVLACDGCGKTGQPDEVRRVCNLPWLEVSDVGGGAIAKHACSPDCLMRIGRDMGGALRDAAQPTTPPDIAGEGVGGEGRG
jgi:hypothetical protein